MKNAIQQRWDDKLAHAQAAVAEGLHSGVRGVREDKLIEAFAKDAPALKQMLREEIDKAIAGSGASLRKEHDLVNVEMRKFKDEATEYVERVRTFRMSVVSEIHKALTAMADIRKFFLSKDHKEELERFAEFVVLCERFDAMKRSGAVDAVLDAILKLEVSS